MIKDSALKKTIEYKKWRDLFDIHSVECKVAIVGALAIVYFLNFSINNNDIENINSLFVALTKDVAISLIGFLGFTVAGLAILTGVISKNVVQKILENDKRKNLEKILLSFYFLGISISIDILGLFCLYIISMSKKGYSLRFVWIIGYIFSYLTIFIIFYAAKLVGNCLEIFFIINESGEKKSSINIREIYDSYRITALEKVYLSNEHNKQILEDYMKTISEQIEDNRNVEQKEWLKDMFCRHFNIKE